MECGGDLGKMIADTIYPFAARSANEFQPLHAYM